jgi:hypothetical protein
MNPLTKTAESLILETDEKKDLNCSFPAIPAPLYPIPPQHKPQSLHRELPHRGAKIGSSRRTKTKVRLYEQYPLAEYKTSRIEGKCRVTNAPEPTQYQMGHEIREPASAELKIIAYIFYHEDSIFWIRKREEEENKRDRP